MKRAREGQESGPVAAGAASGVAAGEAANPVARAATGRMAADGASESRAPLSIEHLRVRPDRVEAVVRIAGERYVHTDAPLVARCLQCAPTLGHHACRNGVGPTFAAVMERTTTPHLLEHLVIDAQTRAARDEGRVFTGTTQFSKALQATVAVSFEDDLVALRAFSETVDFLNSQLLDLRG